MTFIYWASLIGLVWLIVSVIVGLLAGTFIHRGRHYKGENSTLPGS